MSHYKLNSNIQYFKKKNNILEFVKDKTSCIVLIGVSQEIKQKNETK